ncbi:6,7-dimethyl-8-ribityllumazine synthase [Paraburkholderia sp. ZP32-5]|uniref:6,7-dimethyl-8-ribityllumazine synthase n=1 Tax=Paraburkholderia sp. ZP32-5 TaxID=2883245 RepID=UPI001F0148FA|nr:6,7-dimethyl-8-ribityllumazine synthase [Paraburkholderia sp. ZP32-5]
MNSPLTQSLLSNVSQCGVRPKIAFIQAGWHEDIVGQCRDAFFEAMKSHGFDRKDLDIQQVAGAFEIPLAAKRLAASGKYATIVTAAFVVDGGIYRHDFVAQTVVSALMQIQIETDVPVLSGVLTPHKYHATEEHNQFFRDHFRVKGKELADACVSTISGSVTIDSPTPDT